MVTLNANILQYSLVNLGVACALNKLLKVPPRLSFILLKISIVIILIRIAVGFLVFNREKTLTQRSIQLLLSINVENVLF